MTYCRGRSALLMLVCLLTIVCRALGADIWVSGSDSSVVTNNECGYISAVHGDPMLVRSFMAEDSSGSRAVLTDKVNSGDEIRVPEGSRLEVMTGSNIVLVFGGGSHVRFTGFRNFSLADGREAARLDLELLAGDARIQVRRNKIRPECAYISTDGADFLVQRGDVCVSNKSVWQGAVLFGESLARLRRGTTVGAPFSLVEGSVVNEGGSTSLGASERDSLVARLPFSFELSRLALPPLPSMAYELEAP